MEGLVVDKRVAIVFVFILITLIAYMMLFSKETEIIESITMNEHIRESYVIIPPRSTEIRFPGNPVIDTTNPNVPDLFRKKLSSFNKIDEKISDRYASADAVASMENIIGWDPTTSDFKNPDIINSMAIDGIGIDAAKSECVVDKKMLLKKLLNGQELHDIMDVVIPTIRDLDFLESWKPFIEKFHIILIQDGDHTKHLKIPEWADYELYNRLDIERALGDKSWIISQKDASIRNFGFLISRKKFVWSVDDDCFPANGPDGKPVDALMEHALNLLTPSTPYFFNTVYDPYQQCVDFVRGYPYSLRQGVQTVVSHGLWLNMYDYDAPTQLLKVKERNHKYADITVTIPNRILYPLCSMNVAFNRELLGPAVMQGLMGVGQPWGRYDDMFSGWASKVVADHLGLGTKSGAPYIYHNKASNPFTNLAKEYMGLEWQEEAIRFFDSVHLTSLTAEDSYIELANLVESNLAHLSPYFTRLAEAMRLWVGFWRDRAADRLEAIPSRSSATTTSLKTLEAYKEIADGSKVANNTTNVSRSLIDKIYYINMDISTDRRQHIEEMLNKTKIPYERVVPINLGTTEEIYQNYVVKQNFTFCDYEQFRKKINFIDTHGAASLYFTFKQIADKVCKNDIPGLDIGSRVLILEDDVTFDDAWHERLVDAMDALSGFNWSIARLGMWGDQRKEDMINKYWHRVSQPLFIPGWPPQYFYHGILAVLVEVGSRTQPLCDLFATKPVCWIEGVLGAPELEAYCIDYAYTIGHHGDFKSVRGKIDGEGGRKRKRKT